MPKAASIAIISFLRQSSAFLEQFEDSIKQIISKRVQKENFET